MTVGNAGNAADDTGYGSVVYDYRISKYEVTAGQYTEFLNAVASTDTYGLYNTIMWSSEYGPKIERTGISGSYTYSVAADRANRPVNYVSWGDAVRFANWLHNGQPTGAQDMTTTEDGAYYVNGATTNIALQAVTRKSGATVFIPTEDEWYKAAYHRNDGVTGNYYEYPTGSDITPSNDLVNPDPGNSANFYDSGYTIGSPYWMTPVGEFENSGSPYGTFDQGGNLWEWNEAILHTQYRGLRGGPSTTTTPTSTIWAHPAVHGTLPRTTTTMSASALQVPFPNQAQHLCTGWVLRHSRIAGVREGHDRREDRRCFTKLLGRHSIAKKMQKKMDWGQA